MQLAPPLLGLLELPALLLLQVLDLFPHVVADRRPDLPVHQQVLLRGHCLRDLIAEGQLRDVLLFIELFLERLESFALLGNEVCLRLEVLLPLLELADADALVLDDLAHFVEDLALDRVLRLEHHVDLPLLLFLQGEHVRIVASVDAA